MNAHDTSRPVLYDLPRFSLGHMTRCGADLRKIGSDASSMEEVASRTMRYLYERLRDRTLDAPACALARMFVTLPFHSLEPDQQEFAEAVLGRAPDPPSMKCLTLLASAGDEAAGNARHTSAGHKALPLPSAEAIARSPMIAQLMRQLGVEVGTLLSPDARLIVDSEQHSFNVFYVAEASGSPYIPAQREFRRVFA